VGNVAVDVDREPIGLGLDPWTEESAETVDLHGNRARTPGVAVELGG
jgi:hypothetical protein